MWNGEVKVVTGLRRCGKSVLLFALFDNYLREQGVSPDEIIRIELDLTDFADGIADEQLRDSRRALGLDEFGVELELTGLRLRTDLSAFDEAPEFRIPDEALSAWGESVMPWEK